MYSTKKIVYGISVMLFLATMISCTPQEYPDNNDGQVSTKITVSTEIAEPVSGSSAFVMGSINTVSYSTVISYGFYFGTSSNPEINGQKVVLPCSGATFSTTLNNLEPGITYFVKAFVNNGTGEKTGNELSFLIIQRKD